MKVHHRLRGSVAMGILLAGLALLLSPAQRVSARVMAPEPLVVVVESEFRRTDAAAVRAAISEALGSPVLRLTDPGAQRARGTLSISFSADGRHAHIYFRKASGDQAAVLVEVVAGRGADAAGRWVAEPAAAAVRTLDRWNDMTPASEVLDPWLLERVQPTAPGEIHMLPDLADPFEGEPAPDVNIAVDRYYYGSEVLNPWAHSSNPESAERLAAPRPTPR
ncbi:MAG: hypothetical protein KC593_22835 [Myxococcales bacterium]|nr:hypothetical protein [Myxococcales bacterium]MCB9628137.1 hypothetical protein [Sandaracinaceae bacterium]